MSYDQYPKRWQKRRLPTPILFGLNIPAVVQIQLSDFQERLVSDSPHSSGDTSLFQLRGLTPRLAFAIASAALGSAFQHGYNTGVVNAPAELVKIFINETYTERYDVQPGHELITLILSILVSVFCLGGMAGALGTAYIAERFGRKGGLILNNVIVVVATVLFAFCKLARSYEMIIVGRFLMGLNCGLNAGLGPMYLTEISPVNLRGAVGTIYQLVIAFSILVSQILGMPELLGTEERWPYLFGFTICPTIFMLSTMPLCPESPKYILINKGREVAAQKALTWLRGTVEVHDEMDEMRAEYQAMKLVPKVTLRELLVNPILRMPLIIAVVMMLSQQLSGINAAIFYSMDIFKTAGLNEGAAMYGTLGIGVTNVLMTMVSMLLVEKAGRRTLHMIGLAGMMVATISLTICISLTPQAPWLSYLSIISVIGFVIMFSTGPGSIPWFLVTELFGQGPRPIATSIAVSMNWSANFVVGLVFLPICDVLHQYTFLIFTAILAVFLVYTYFKVPETRNKTVEDIATYFRKKVYGN